MQTLWKNTRAYQTLVAESEKNELSHAYLLITDDKRNLTTALKTFVKPLSSFTRFDFSVLCFILFDKVADKNEYLAVRASSLVVCDNVQLVQHFLFYSDR